MKIDKHVLTPMELEKFVLYVMKEGLTKTIESQPRRTVVAQTRDTKALFSYWFSKTIRDDIFPQIPTDLLSRVLAQWKILTNCFQSYLKNSPNYAEYAKLVEEADKLMSKSSDSGREVIWAANKKADAAYYQIKLDWFKTMGVE